jgi:divalent metal cation (Fe/Co/Zn/Cd) transporter
VTGFVGFAGCNLLGLAGYEFDQLFNAPTSQTTVITASLVQLLAAMTAVGLCSGFFGRYQARLLDSWSLAFSFNQSLLDAGLMVLIVAGLVGVSLGIGWLDPLVAALVVLLTLVSGWQVINRQLPSMMQQVAIAPESLIATIRQVEGILHCYDLRSRGMVGRLVYVEMRLILHPECLGVAQSIAERVERVIRHHYGPVKVVVHIDGDRTMAQPIKVLS